MQDNSDIPHLDIPHLELHYPQLDFTPFGLTLLLLFIWIFQTAIPSSTLGKEARLPERSVTPPLLITFVWGTLWGEGRESIGL